MNVNKNVVEYWIESQRQHRLRGVCHHELCRESSVSTAVRRQIVYTAGEWQKLCIGTTKPTLMQT